MTPAEKTDNLKALIATADTALYSTNGEAVKTLAACVKMLASLCMPEPSAPPAPPEPLPSLGEVAKEAFLQRANKNNADCWDAAAAAVLAEHARRTKREPTDAEVEEVARMIYSVLRRPTDFDWNKLPCGGRDYLILARAVLRRERGLDA